MTRPNRMWRWVTLIDRDRAERETLVNETWAADRDTLHRYDAAGNATERLTDGTYDRQAASYIGGTRTAFIYDEANRETRMNVSPPSGASRTTTKSYYPSGSLEARTLSSGTEEGYTYATDGLLTRMTRGSAADPTAKKDQAYAYDLNANRTKDERGRFQYNARSQLVKWIDAKDGSDEHTSFVLNGSGATLEELTTQGPDTDYAYTADRLDSSKQSSADERTHYDYNDFGSITCARLGAPEPADPCDTAGLDATDVEYLYDAFERRIGSNQPESAPSSEDFTYAYDGLDRRDTKTDEASGERFELAYVGTTELLSREAHKNGDKSLYDYDSNGARQGQTQTEAGQEPRHRAFGLDANGSVESLLGENGAEVGSYAYDPYGELADPEPGDAQDAEAELTEAAQDNPFRFEGFYYDSGVKTYDMQARTYGPEIGRFYSQDRYEAAGADLGLQSDPLTQNRYVFAGGNPVSNVEWDGHMISPTDSEANARAADGMDPETGSGGGTPSGGSGGSNAPTSVNAVTGPITPDPRASVLASPLVTALPVGQSQLDQSLDALPRADVEALDEHLRTLEGQLRQSGTDSERWLEPVSAALLAYANVELPAISDGLYGARAMQSSYLNIATKGLSPGERSAARVAAEALDISASESQARGIGLKAARALGWLSVPAGFGADYASELASGSEATEAAVKAGIQTGVKGTAAAGLAGLCVASGAGALAAGGCAAVGAAAGDFVDDPIADVAWPALDFVGSHVDDIPAPVTPIVPFP